MAKVLDSLPPGMARAVAQAEVAQKASPGPSPGTRGATLRDDKGEANKALRRPNSSQGMNQYSEWMMRRCDAFGFASSKYFKKSGVCPRPNK